TTAFGRRAGICIPAAARQQEGSVVPWSERQITLAAVVLRGHVIETENLHIEVARNAVVFAGNAIRDVIDSDSVESQRRRRRRFGRHGFSRGIGRRGERDRLYHLPAGDPSLFKFLQY